MRNVDKLLVKMTATTAQVIRVIDEGEAQVALMVDDDNQLKHAVTDGDIRRAIIAGVALDAPLAPFLADGFIHVDSNMNEAGILSMMGAHNVHQIPVLDSGRLVGLHVLDDLIAKDKPDLEVVIMAGGLGTRLLPLTENCPKPMLKLGGRPILEIIINSLVKDGVTKIYLSVNYLKEVIMEYFGDGAQFGVEIEYLIERSPLGTAGALTLIDKIDKPILVMNGDVLTRVDYRKLLDSHISSGVSCTVCVRKHVVEVPFGVVDMDDMNILGVTEKPVFEHFVNAGIYVLDSSILSVLEKGRRTDMPDLLKQIIGMDKPVQGFPVYEYWLDIGRHGELDQAKKDYHDIALFDQS